MFAIQKETLISLEPKITYVYHNQECQDVGEIFKKIA